MIQQGKDANGFSYSLQDVLASILESKAGRCPREPTHSIGHKDLGGGGQIDYPRRDIDSSTVHRRLFLDDIACVQPHVQLHAGLFCGSAAIQCTRQRLPG